ncbi:MAG: hypothetical protein WC815_23940 [Vicinamibacterales bacterium]|jgi:hypothetical protein
MYNETPLAQEAKALIKQHLHVPDGVAQGHVDGLNDVQLADLVASRDYPPHDRGSVIRSVLTAATAVPPPALPHHLAPPDLVSADPPAAAEATTEEPAPKKPRRTRPD